MEFGYQVSYQILVLLRNDTGCVERIQHMLSLLDKHSSQYFQLMGKQWSEKLENLKWNILWYPNFFKKLKKENEATTKISFQEVHLLARQEKLFTDGELKILISATEKLTCLRLLALW